MRLIILYSRYLTKRILIILYLALFVGLFMVLRSPFVDLYFTQVVNPFYDFFLQWSNFIYTILIIVIFGITSTMLEMALAYFNSTARAVILKRKAYIHKYINESLFEHLTSKSDNESDKKYIQKFKRKFITDYPRLIFINRLRRIMALSTGDVNEHCKRLFNLMNANGLIRSYLYSPYLRHKHFALTLVGEFNLIRFTSKLKRLMNNKNDSLASEALYAYIKLNPETDLSFLIKRNKPLSKLDFNRIIKIVANYKNVDYESLMATKIPMIATIGIYFAAKNKDQSMKANILKYIDHGDYNVRNEAQKSLLLLTNENDASILIEKFNIFTTKNKYQILNLLGGFSANASIISFLHSIVERSNFEIKVVAMNSLISIDTLEVVRYRNHPNLEVSKAFKQLTDFNM